MRKWRARFLARRLDGLSDEPRPGVPRTIGDAQVEEVVARTLEEVPEGATHWSKRELARRVGISPTSVYRIWRAFGLQPWRTEDFKISPDPLLMGCRTDCRRSSLPLRPGGPSEQAAWQGGEQPAGVCVDLRGAGVGEFLAADAAAEQADTGHSGFLAGLHVPDRVADEHRLPGRYGRLL